MRALSLSLSLPAVTARAALAPAATPAQRVAPGAATAPGADPDPPAGLPRRRRQEGARPQPDPRPAPSLAPSRAPDLARVHLHRLRTNSLPALAPALALAPSPALVPAPPQQTANTEMGTPVCCNIDL